jgi:hypothetical protein
MAPPEKAFEDSASTEASKGTRALWGFRRVDQAPENRDLARTSDVVRGKSYVWAAGKYFRSTALSTGSSGRMSSADSPKRGW